MRYEGKTWTRQCSTVWSLPRVEHWSRTPLPAGRPRPPDGKMGNEGRGRRRAERRCNRTDGYYVRIDWRVLGSYLKSNDRWIGTVLLPTIRQKLRALMCAGHGGECVCGLVCLSSPPLGPEVHKMTGSYGFEPKCSSLLVRTCMQVFILGSNCLW
jgi:hypothetical protein